jgi:hypothetical protein
VVIRTLILTVFVFSGQLTFGQTYSSLTTDKEIYDFLNWMTRTEKKYDEEPFLSRKIINNEISSWHKFNFIKSDTINNYSVFDRQYLFSKQTVSDTIFNTSDSEFLLQQFLAIKDSVWHNRFQNSKLLKSKNQLIPNRYYYSIPLFSIDKKYVLVHKIYYCGRLCGYLGYYIYKKISNSRWEFMTCIRCGIS